MTILTEKDKGLVAGNVRELIVNSGRTGDRYILDPTSENLYGRDDPPHNYEETFPLELQDLPADTLSKLGADAVINILPEQELNQEDRVGIGWLLYKVLSVEEQNCFGVVSHKTVRLVRHHGN